jgi:PAS domain S-box-containing protein
MFAQKLSKWHLLSSWLIIVTIVLLFGSQLLFTQYQNLNDEIAQFKAQELQSRVLLNRSAIAQAITYIDHKRNETHASFRRILKTQTEAFVALLGASKEPLTMETVQTMAQKFSQHHDIELRFYQSQPTHDLEGYHVNKEENEVGYLHHIPQLNTYVMGVQALSYFEDKAKQHILETLRFIRFGKENSGYVFIMELYNIDGGKGFAKEILLPINPAKENILIDSDVVDEQGNRYREDYLSQLKEKGFAITRYVYPLSDTDTNVREKISYLEWYKPWGWVIGTGVYFEHLNENIDVYKNRSLERLKTNLYFLALLLIVFSVVAYAISRYFNRRLLEEVSTYEEAIEKHQSALNQYKHAVMESTIYSKTDPEGILVDVNDEFCRISGYTKEELLGQSHKLIRHPEEPDSTFDTLWETIKAKRIFKAVLKNRAKNGKTFYASTTIVPILDTHGAIQEYIALRIDITEQMEQELRIQRQITDRLTGLSNIERLREDIRTQLGDKLALVKVTGLKDISSFYGHDVAESLLKLCATELQTLTKKDPITLYRFAFDTFALLGSTHSKKENFLHVTRACVQNLKTYSKSVGQVDFDLGAHGGVAFGNEHAFQEAQAALDQARANGQEVIVFDTGLSILQTYQNNIAWTRIIKQAIEHRKIMAYGQAIVDVRTGNVCNYEVLMRLQKEDGTIISPNAFLHVAKRSNLYLQLTEQIIDLSFAHFGHFRLPFSINLSAQDFRNPELLAYLEAQIDHFHVHDLLTLEIVETDSVDSFETISVFIERMQQKGVKIAIDDFGTGYSNFEYLLRIKANYIKIDGSLIRAIDTDTNCQKVVAAIVAFAKESSMEVVAEFVHSKAVLDQVQALGITKCQGYYFHTPDTLDTLVSPTLLK